MWITLDGPRILTSEERNMVYHATRKILEGMARTDDNGLFNSKPKSLPNQTTSDWNQPDNATGILWFDQWDPEQRLWLLERVLKSLSVESEPPPPRSAIFEATVEAIFSVIRSEVFDDDCETREENPHSNWRTLVFDAYRSRCTGRENHFSNPDQSIDYAALIAHLQCNLVGPTAYDQAEQFRDGPPEKLSEFLISKGLPENYLCEIPPITSKPLTRKRINRLLEMVQQTN